MRLSTTMSPHGLKLSSKESHRSSTKRSRLHDPHQRTPQERREEIRAVVESHGPARKETKALRVNL